MSQYLIIKKGDIVLGEWSRNTPLYKAIPGANYDFKEFNPEDILTTARENLTEEIESYKKSLDKYEKMFSSNISYEERWDVLSSIDELKEDIEEIKKYIHYVDFMYESYESDKYCSDKYDKPVWTYYIS